MSKLTQVNINKAMNVETKYTSHAINILSSIWKCTKRIRHHVAAVSGLLREKCWYTENTSLLKACYPGQAWHHIRSHTFKLQIRQEEQKETPLLNKGNISSPPFAFWDKDQAKNALDAFYRTVI